MTQTVPVGRTPTCDYCGTTDMAHKGLKHGRIRYYHCRQCTDPDTGRPSLTKVILVRVDRS